LDHRPAELVDAFPTILEVAGIPAISGKPGINLLGPATRKASFAEVSDQLTTVAFMWRTDALKLILSFPKQAVLKGTVQLADVTDGELYDLKSDPKEWRNLYAMPEAATHRQRLSRELIDHLNTVALKPVKMEAQ
jgi:arylsulfatase A-like enzyme